MAKAKVATSRKRMVSKRESDQPDEVMTQLTRLSKHLSQHFWLYIMAIVFVMVAAWVVQWYLEEERQADVASSQSVVDVFTALQGTVATDIKTSDESAAEGTDATVTPDYDTREKRAEAALMKAKTIADDLSDSLTGLAKAGVGRAEMDLKKWEDARRSFAAAAEADADSTLAWLVLENQGRAAQAAGKNDEAVSCFEQMTGAKDLYYQVRGYVLLGDVHNPNYIAKGSGDSAKARTHYESALSALSPGEGQVLTVSLKALRTDIHRRKALLP